MIKILSKSLLILTSLVVIFGIEYSCAQSSDPFSTSLQLQNQDINYGDSSSLTLPGQVNTGADNTDFQFEAGTLSPTNSNSRSSVQTDSNSRSSVQTDGNSGSSAGRSIGKLQNPLSGVNSVGELVGKAAEIFSYIVILFAVLALVWTGLQYILARGNSEKMKELSQRLLWIVIGIAIVIGARIIVEIVINTVASTGVVKEEVINQANRAIRNQ